MLKLSKSIEYSLLALIFISNNENKSVVSSRKISEELNIPYELLSKLLQKLVQKGIVKSRQGKFGGYNLVIPKNELSIYNVINAIEENVKIVNCTHALATQDDCSKIDNCEIRDPFYDIQNKIISIFESITLEQLSKQ
jgi:Rrf2 family protein